MTFGPDYIYECLQCGKPFRRGSMVSGSTLNAKLFSDGKRIMPHLPEFPILTKCEGCNAIIDIRQQKEIGAHDCETQEHKARKDIPYAKFLSVDDLYRALEAFPEQEGMIRQKIWWASNDLIRDGLKGRLPLSPEEQEEFIRLRGSKYDENCSALIKFFDPEDQNQRIIIAELYRNLGEFDKCLELINSLDDDNDIKTYLKERFAFECQQGNKFVILISAPTNTPEVRQQPDDQSQVRKRGWLHSLKRLLSYPKPPELDTEDI